MRMPIEKVAAHTKCPSVLGGRIMHYPRMVSGKPQTMPYLDSQPYDVQTLVILSRCGNARLLPPQDADSSLPHLLCEDCELVQETNTAESTDSPTGADGSQANVP